MCLSVVPTCTRLSALLVCFGVLPLLQILEVRSCCHHVRCCRNESRPTFILPGEYDASCVGPSAMALGEPRWTMPPHVEVEKSVSFTKGSMFKIISESYENAAACRHIQALMSAKGKAGTTSTRKLANKRQDESGAARYFLFLHHALLAMHGHVDQCLCSMYHLRHQLLTLPPGGSSHAMRMVAIMS